EPKTFRYTTLFRSAAVMGQVAGGDAITFTLATTALQFSGVASYSITVTLGSNPNYSVTKSDGTLTVNPAVATVTANNKTKTYGDTNPALDATVTGQVVGGGDAITYTLATTALQLTGLGSYPITVTLGSNPNYSVTKTDGTLTITKASATVALSNLTQATTGNPLTPTAATSPAGLAISWTNAPQTNVGIYTVTATIADQNYQGSASGQF